MGKYKSFSSQVKEELAKRISPARHCQIAELAAIMNFCGQYGRDAGGGYTVGFQTENEAVVRKGFTLLKKTYNIDTDIALNEIEMQGILQKIGSLNKPVSALLLKNSCCQRAFLRGAFLSVGSMSDPAKSYHLEFDCCDAEKAEQLRELMKGFEIESKIILRKKYHVVYLKEGSGIVDLLNVCEAPVSLMNVENLRILKEMRNSVNRRVNCETANIARTVSAAARQVEDIQYLQLHYGFQNLPDNLREMAEIRLENPDTPLKELGEYFQPPLGKSGVNHRLRKLSELADTIRERN
ncbi:DNA-binding protein WhiA [Acetatifactor muris]|uniref:Probable cell division protein WhiA n=1 Tax=Acetatifactor muris TaxID=879566 RepID=A0A2K4ZE58_9FIRM|nr:DNA-binding protein WhiA [Acetatifactor muris]MCR2047146.1 DNA-binding protein WhiA [Acetatifactor muris]SOY28755.1 Putative sporulation transcription regulator WhiA [Acetatifactor muris]